MKQSYVLEVDGKPKMVFREKGDAAAANWIKGAAISGRGQSRLARHNDHATSNDTGASGVEGSQCRDD